MTTLDSSHAPASEASGPDGGTSHDRLFKTLFEEFLGDLLELVHPELAATLDLGGFQPADKELFTDFRKQGHVEADVVRQARSREDEPQLVLVHVETEGKFLLGEFDDRIFRYNLHLTLNSDFPVVSVAVFLTGGAAGLEIREVSKRVGPFRPLCFQYLAFGLSGSLAEEYVDRPQPLAAALAALMSSRVWDEAEKKMHCLEGIRRAEGLDVRQQFLLARVVDTYVELTEREQQRFVAELARAENKEVREMVVTWEEALAESRAEGESHGRVEGRAEGRAEGEARAKQEDLLLVARHRLTSMPADFEDKIRGISDLERLNDLLERLIKTESIDDLDLQ